MKLFWLSFADETGPRGVCIVRATTFLEAVMLTGVLKINPGGRVAGCALPEGFPKPPAEIVEKLLSLDDLTAAGVPTAEWCHDEATGEWQKASP